MPAMLLLGSILTLSSPDGASRATLSVSGTLTHSAQFSGNPALPPADIGVTADGVKFGAGQEVLAAVTGSCVEKFATRGNHREVAIPFNTLTLTLRDTASRRDWQLEARMSNDTFAWRCIIPAAAGAEVVTVSGEASSFRLPEDCQVWVSERPNAWKFKSYAGYWLRVPANDLPSFSSQGPVQLPPLVAELTGSGGWLVVTEAALVNYSGMRLQAESGGVLRANFTEGARGFTVRDKAVTPWRVLRRCRSLDELVDTAEVLEALSPPPDPLLFTDQSWIRPGRAVWFWWSARRAGTPAEERQMVECARQLGFEYSLVDEGWGAWQDTWAQVAELAALGKKDGIGILLWLHQKQIADPADRHAALRAMLDQIAAAGAAGIKVDFFDAESKDMVDLQHAILREAAQRRLLVVFHGCHKPTGESRTWPNQLTREAIRGLELNGHPEGPITAAHNCALPFTRLAIGPGDYTPVGFSKPNPTTWAHQLATGALFNSPLMVLAENPLMVTQDPRCAPALELLKTLPVTWDETRVLPPSQIGECAVLARRSGDEWWVAAINNNPLTLTLRLDFLGEGDWRGVMVSNSDDPQHPLRRQELTLTRDSQLTLPLTAADGFLLRCRR